MNLQKFSKYLAVFLISLLVLAGCGGSDGGEFKGGNQSGSGNTKRTITGYAEDDPMVNATIKITDESGNVVAQTKSDANGKYSLTGKFKEGKIYILESKGKIQDRNVTLHSIFKFSSDKVINANPLTELKYQIVKSGKSIEEAEKLVRDYFLVINGEKLEQNRFDAKSSFALGMIDLAKLYDGKLPVDAIAKIKEDILRNAEEDTKDFSYRDLVKKKITLKASAESVEVGTPVTIRVVGLNNINKNYILKWSGIPDNATENNNSVTFIINDIPQDVFVRASLYEKDSNESRFLSSSEIGINFYKIEEENNVTIENGSVENNITTDSYTITIPAGVASDGANIDIAKLSTGSEKIIDKFALDTENEVDGNIIFTYKYTPNIVLEPRKLQVSFIDGSDIKMLQIENIDYENHLITFKIPFSNPISRDVFNSHNIINIEYVKSQPSKLKILDFMITYEKYLKKIFSDFLGGNSDTFWNYLNSDIGKAKFVYTMQQKEKGEYKFNMLATAINMMMAKEKAEEASYTNWRKVAGAYLRIKNNSVYEHYNDRDVLKENIILINDIISPWVGAVKLTKGQEAFIKYAKAGVNAALTVASAVSTGGVSSLVTIASGTTGIATDLVMPSDLGADAVGNSYPLIYNTMEFIKQPVNIGLKNYSVSVVKDWVIGATVNLLFQYINDSMIEKNYLATAPIFIGIGTYVQYIDDNFLVSINSNAMNDVFPIDKSNINQNIVKGKAFNKEDFVNLLFPSNINSIDHYYNDFVKNTRNLILHSNSNDESQFSKEIDPNRRLEKLFLNKPNTNVGYISDQDRGLAYMLLRYAYGDRQMKLLIDKIFKAGEFKAFQILLQSVFLPNHYVTESKPIFSWFGTIYEGQKVIIKSKYKISSSDKLLNFINIKKSLKMRDKTEGYINKINNFNSFEKVMQIAKLKLTNEQLQSVKIKKIKVDTYGVGLSYSNDNNAWVLDKSSIEHHIYQSSGNINDKFTYDSSLEKNVLSFATLFDGEDFTLFDNKLVGFKITLVYEKNGIEKVISKDFVFTTLSDTEHLIKTNFKGATLKSSVKDALSGEPIVNAQVTLLPSGLTDFTDSNGNYKVDGLAAGKYKIVISKNGYKQVEAQVSLAEDETKLFEVSLAIDKDHSNTAGGAKIIVKDAINGNIITNDYIKIREGQNNKTGEVVKEIVNDGNNSLNISLAPGNYTVEIGANGYAKAYNTITIIGDENKTYEFSISPVLPEDQVRIVLTWGENPSDLDSHLVRFTNGNEDYHIYYSNMKPANADANLDVDDTDSYGPETITINSLSNTSTYKYYVHDFSNGSDHNDTQLKASNAKVDVYYGDQVKTFYVPNETGNVWKVFEIVNGQIVPCTSGCVFGVDGETDPNIGQRSLSGDKKYFEHLPNK